MKPKTILKPILIGAAALVGAIIIIPVLLKLAFVVLAAFGAVSVVKKFKQRKSMGQPGMSVGLNPARAFQQSGRLSISID